MSLIVYDLLGNEVGILVNKYQEIGNHTVTFDGRYYPSGVYCYKIIVGKYSSIKKMILLK